MKDLKMKEIELNASEKEIKIKTLEGKKLSYGLIKEINFSLRQGETVALMGPNGAGKSTLARLIAGIYEPAGGRISLLEEDREIPWSAVRRWQEIGFIGQHPRRQTIGATVGEELGFGLMNLGYPRKQVQEKVREIALELGLQDKLQQSPATLSGGERQRLVLGAILALEPAFLILDEALSMLDTKAQEACLKLLAAKKEVTGQLWITHDPQLAKKADRLWVMKEGKLLEGGSPQDALRDMAFCHKYGIRTEDSFLDQKGCAFESDKPVFNAIGENYFRVQGIRFGDIYEKESGLIEAKLKESEFKGLELKGIERKDSMLKEQKSSEAGEKKIVLEWQEAEYPGRLQLTEQVRAKTFLVILGSSGAGKSTLLESAIGLLQPVRGKFIILGQELRAKNFDLQQKARLLLQEPGEYILGNTVYEEVFYLQSKKEKRAKAQINLEYLQVFGIPSSKAYVYPEHISGGERQQVALAAALESLPEILLLDEPMLGIDAEGRGRFQELLRALKGRMTIIYVTHDWTEVSQLADEVWLLKKGQVAYKWQREKEQKEIDPELLKEAGVRC